MSDVTVTPVSDRDVMFTYTSSRMAETMAKEFMKGLVRDNVIVEIIDNVVNIIVKE